MALLFLVLLTLFGGYLAKVYVWKTILGQTGLFNNALMTLGLIQEPVAAFLYNPVAVVITLTHYLVPLAVLPLYGSLRSVQDSPLRSARDLGASPYRCFRDIVLPQCQTGLFAAFALTFLFVAGDWVTPKLVGGPHTSMIGTFIEYQYGSRFNQPMGSAMAFSVIATSVVMLGCVAMAGRLILRPR
jgi:spermidine/putrescine transport system permease protein